MFTEKEFRKILEVLKIHEDAYGKTRYFTRQYMSQLAYLGQHVLGYIQREEAPYLRISSKRRTIPYAEGFEARSVVNPFLVSNNLLLAID